MTTDQSSLQEDITALSLESPEMAFEAGKIAGYTFSIGGADFAKSQRAGISEAKYMSAYLLDRYGNNNDMGS
jgi:hypothetical protein